MSVADISRVTVDYVCPYSKKIAATLDKVVIPLLDQQYAGKVKVIFRNQVQPWHASSTFVHEAGLSVRRYRTFKSVLAEADIYLCIMAVL